MGGHIRIALAGAVSIVAAMSCGAAFAEEPALTCTREEFQSVVEETSEHLRELNSRNRPEFQTRLRQLKAKYKWTHDQFMEHAKPFVRDDKTKVFDRSTEELLSAIASMGNEGASAAKPDCAMLLELRARMNVLVETQNAKWSYLFQKINAELTK
jgi:hypothetical protein